MNFTQTVFVMKEKNQSFLIDIYLKVRDFRADFPMVR